MSTFWMMVVAKPYLREDPEKIENPYSAKNFKEWHERTVNKDKLDEIRRLTGCYIVLYDAQPEYNRPDPFYYIQGTFWAVNQATFLIQKMQCEIQAEKLERLEEKLDNYKKMLYH